MRTSKAVAVMGGIMALVWAFGSRPARADDQPAAPADPTRGQWDSFLDPFRDVEDSLTGMQKSVEDASKVHISAGLVEAYQWNFNRPGNGLNTFHSLDPYHDFGQPNFGQLAFARPSESWIPGFSLKLDFGAAAKKIKSDWNGDGQLNVGDTFEKNNFDVEEAYVHYTLADTGTPLDGLDIKGGKFVTTAGAEVIEPWLNPNFSRSLLFGLAIPFTHTGGLVSYPVTDKFSVGGGIVLGWDNVADNNDSPSFLANSSWIVTDQVSLAGTFIYGPEQTDHSGRKRGLGDLVATIKPTDALTFLLNYDYGNEQKAALDGSSAEWQGFAAIGSYNFTDRFSMALRGEWFEDSDGARTGAAQTLWEWTATAKYLVTQHLYGQAELRRDQGTKNTFVKNNDLFNKGQTIIGFDVGWVFN
jgi:putative OmpL-like beta-barrel porin-2